MVDLFINYLTLTLILTNSAKPAVHIVYIYKSCSNDFKLCQLNIYLSILLFMLLKRTFAAAGSLLFSFE